MIAVVHLVWGPFGAPPLRRFLSSYHEQPPGAEHELVILFNGVEGGRRAELLEALSDTEHRLLTLPEPVQDLTAYAYAAAQLEHERVCFMNSYCVILAPGWLGSLDAALSLPGAGLVGATGSWASLCSNALNAVRLPNAYRGVLPSWKEARQHTEAITAELRIEAAHDPQPSQQVDADEPDPPGGGREDGVLMRRLRPYLTIPEQALRFEPFPNHHLRSNVFMLERDVFASLRIPPIRRKMDAYLLESGRHSFTRQVERQGLRALVATRDGAAYDQGEWHLSRTLFQGDQERLLVSDNQTRSYGNGPLERRLMLSRFAWGMCADPSAPTA